MRRTVFKILSVPLFIIIILLSLLLFGIKNSAFHQFVISKGNTAIAGSFTLGSLKISLTDMRFEIRDIELSGSDGQKIAGFKRLLIDISTLGLLKRKFVVEKAVLDKPWVVLETGPEGELTLVKAFSSQKIEKNGNVKEKKDSTSKLFPIEIRDLQINDGRTFFKTVNDSFKIQADGLSVKAKGKTVGMLADLLIALDSALIEMNGREICLSDISLMARMNDLEIDTVDLKINTDNSMIKFNGKAGSLINDPDLDINAVLELALTEIDSIFNLGGNLNGSSNLKMRIVGKASDPDLGIKMAYNGGEIWGYQIDKLFIESHLVNKMLNLNPIHIEIGNGKVDFIGDIDLRDLFPQGFIAKPSSVHDLKYSLGITGDSISINKLVPAIDGIVDMSINLDGTGLKPDSLFSSLGMSLEIRDFQAGSSFLPFNGMVVCTAKVVDGTANINVLELRFFDDIAKLFMNGTYGILSKNVDANLDISVSELGTLFNTFGLGEGNGKLNVSALVGGNLKNPSGKVDLDINSLEFGKIRIGNIELGMLLDSSGTARIDEMFLTNDSSHVQLGATASVLQNGLPVPVDQIEFEVSAFSDKLFISDFIDSVSGLVRLDADLNGDVNNLMGGIKVNLTDLIAAGQHIQKIDLNSSFEHQKVKIEPLRIIVSPQQDIIVKGWVSLKDSFDIKLDVPKIRLNELSVLKSVDSLYGDFMMHLSAHGTYTEPIAKGNVIISNIMSGENPIDDISLKLAMIDKKVEATGVIAGNLDASYDLGTRDFFAEWKFDKLLLTPYLALSGQNLEGTITALMQVSGNTDSIEEIEGELNLSSLALNFRDIPVMETSDLNAKLQNKKYLVSDFSMKLAEKGEMEGRASGFLNGPHDIAMSGKIPLDIVRQFSPDLSDITGNILIDAVFKGTQEESDLRADLQLEDVAMTLPGVSQKLNSVNGRILADQNRIRIEEISGKIDEGDINLNGELKLDRLKPADLTAEIALSKLPVNIPDMLDLLVDAKLRIKGNPDTSRVEGDLVLLDGLYYQDIVTNPFAGIGQRKRKEPVKSDKIDIPYLKNMKFDIGIQARSPFRVDNNLAQLTISPDLHLMGNIQSPVLNGRANVEEGNITYFNRVFTVERGVIDFVNPYAIEPKVDIMGKIPIQEYEITIIVSGSPDDLVFKLECDDSGLEDQDIVSLLVLGMTTDELQNDFQSGISSGQSNQQMLASLVASTFGEDIRKATGLDMLEIETGNDDDQESDRISVTVGKQVTRRLGTIYTVETESGEILQRATAEYRLLQNFFIAGYQDTRGVFGGELRFTWQKR